jgi:outer membrane protein TolC
MRKIMAILLLVGYLAALPIPQEEPTKELTLKDAIVLALKRNLDLQVEMTNPELYWQTLKANSAIFIPRLEVSLQDQETNSPATDAFSGADVVKRETETLSLRLSQQIALGGTFEVEMRNQKVKSNSIWSTINPSLSSVLTFTLAQPLLKNFGTFATKKDIYIAANDYKKSKLQLKQAVIDLIYNVEDAYWNLVYAYQDLDAKKKSLQRSQDLLRQNEIKVRVGAAARMDILQSQAEVASYESQVIQAEKTIQMAEDYLKRILNLSQQAERLIPSDTPEIKPVETDFNAFLLEALENRPDIEQARLELKNHNINVKYARNQMLPDLQLTATYWTTGQGGDQIIYDQSPLFGGVPIGFVQKDIWETVKDTVSNLYRNYQVGLRLSIPLSFSQERAQLAQAKINLKRGLLNLKNIENTIYSEVKEVIKELEANQKLVESNQIALKLQEEKLKAEQKKLSVGLTTNFEVLNYQRDVAQAETNLLNSIKEYNMTVARINRRLAKTLEAYSIKFKDFMKESK